MHIWELPSRRASRDPSGPCIADDAKSLDNAAFQDAVLATAATLAADGVGPDDMVAVVLPNRVELVVTLFAAWHLGACVTPVNPALTPVEAGYQIHDSGAKVVVGDPAATSATTLDVSALQTRGAGRSVPAEPAARSDGLALVIYTSGTTGRPKGVMLDHANVEAMCQMIVEGLGLRADDHSLLILPLFHVNGIMVSVLSPLLAGGRATIAARFRPDTFFAEVERARPTYFSAVPAIYAMLATSGRGAPDMSSLRQVVCGAAPMPAELIGAFEQLFRVPDRRGVRALRGRVRLNAQPAARPAQARHRRPPASRAGGGPSHADGTIDRDGVGEVVIKGPNVMRGYLNRPEDTASTVVDGWLHTGDVGRFDEDGYLVLVDRIKDMIIRGGENIYPKEIENVLYAHPDVVEAAVVGAADPVYGEIPVAFVALRAGSTATGDDLRTHCARSLARMKIPTRIDLVEALPKNAVGKIDKPTLRKGLQGSR